MSSSSSSFNFKKFAAKTLKDYGFILVVLSVMIFVVTVGHLVPHSIQRGAYTLSAVMRSFLMMVIPFLVLPFIVLSITHLKSNGLKLVVTLLLMISTSNFISILIGGTTALQVVPHLPFSLSFNQGDAAPLMPYFDYELPTLLSVEIVLLVGFILGLTISSLNKNSTMQKMVTFFETYRDFSLGFFQKIFIPLLPLYIFGTLLKLNAENDFGTVFSDFSSLIMLIFCLQTSYIFFVFIAGCGFKLKEGVACYVRSIPAGLLGFSTMSSLVTMPVTLKIAEKNLKDKTLAQVAIPATVNCHDIGECISLSMLSMAIYMMANGMQAPDLMTFLKFSMMLAVAQFSGVSVPGGSIVILIPLLSAYLGFSAEMIGLLTTIAIFMDPLGTGQNVMGNSAFALVIQKVFKWMKPEAASSLPRS